MNTPTDAEVVADLRSLVEGLRANQLSAAAEFPGNLYVIDAAAMVDVLDALASGRRPCGMSPEQIEKARVAPRPQGYCVARLGIGWPGPANGKGEE